jgi:hypothetical protein
MKPPRMVIYTKDVQRITGKCPRSCQTILRNVRLKFNKQPYQLVTLREFCEYMNLKEDELITYLFFQYQ